MSAYARALNPGGVNPHAGWIQVDGRRLKNVAWRHYMLHPSLSAAGKYEMSIDAEVLNSEPVDRLCQMYVSEYASSDLVPSMLNAVGACAGFAAQIAVWRELVLPANRNPGDFLVFVTTKIREIFFYGEAINLFLVSSLPDRMSFLSLSAAVLRDASELPNIGELLRHVALSLGKDHFGKPRLPSGIHLNEFPRVGLLRTWEKAAQILEECRPAEWPVLLGATAYNLVSENRNVLAPATALRILLEAAAPVSKLNPAMIDGCGVPTPSFNNWSNRALRPEKNQEIVGEVRAVMPVMPAKFAFTLPKVSETSLVVERPTVGFVNLSGNRYENFVAADNAAIGGLFQGRVRLAANLDLKCDVLFLYCGIDHAGRVVGNGSLLREVIAKSGARVAVVASEILPEIVRGPELNKFLRRDNYPPANIVITTNRKGEAFGRFFRSLFELMMAGDAMPSAWVKLAPQGPRLSQDAPVMVCIMEAGPVTFGG